MADTNVLNSEINSGLPAHVPDEFKNPEVKAAVELLLNAFFVLHQNLELYVGVTTKPEGLRELLTPDETILRHMQGRLYVVAGENLSTGHFVNLYNDGGTLKARKADSTNTRPAQGYVNVAGNTGDTIEVILSFGIIGLGGVNPGDIIYLGTAGLASLTPNTTPGEINQVLGFGVATNLVYVYIQDNFSGVLVTPEYAFTDLTDVPANYTGHATKTVVVKSDETGLEFTTSGAGLSRAEILNLPQLQGLI